MVSFEFISQPWLLHRSDILLLRLALKPVLAFAADRHRRLLAVADHKAAPDICVTRPMAAGQSNVS